MMLFDSLIDSIKENERNQEMMKTFIEQCLHSIHTKEKKKELLQDLF